jgi:hypothetical protein
MAARSILCRAGVIASDAAAAAPAFPKPAQHSVSLFCAARSVGAASSSTSDQELVQ